MVAAFDPSGRPGEDDLRHWYLDWVELARRMSPRCTARLTAGRRGNNQNILILARFVQRVAQTRKAHTMPAVAQVFITI
jgi:hypothetical protein